MASPAIIVVETTPPSNITVNTTEVVASVQVGNGPQGAAGENGVGVPSGGTAGQILAKVDNTNYNTEWVDQAEAGAVNSVNGQTGNVVIDPDDMDDTSTAHKFVTAAEKTKLSNISGVNTGDQTTIVGISGTRSQFDTACSDANFLYSGDVTQYTDEMAQDAVGSMIDSSLVYTDGTPLLQRAALTGDVVASAGSNSTTISDNSVTLAKMADMATASLIYRKTAGTGDPEVNSLATLKTDLGLTGTNSGDQTSIVGITGTKAQFDSAVSDGNILYVGDVTQYTDEQAQDAVGSILTDSSTIDFTYNDVSNTITASIIDDSITYAKIQNVSSTDRILGRSTSGAGDIEEIVCTAAGRALIDDTDATAQRSTLGLGTLATQNGTFSGTSSGTNTGDQTSIVGISGTKAQFDTACSDGNFLYVGDVTLPNVFNTIAVSGQSNVVADSSTDTLTLVAGTNVTITTDAATDSITISASGSGGSGLTQPQVMALASMRI